MIRLSLALFIVVSCQLSSTHQVAEFLPRVQEETFTGESECISIFFHISKIFGRQNINFETFFTYRISDKNIYKGIHNSFRFFFCVLALYYLSPVSRVV